ncbi:unnamed protein product [Sphenostylis stenocarpa]|uniref:Lysozyme n=1 Tax=Sphenostylis stenocarpa TaxID=92480 RepID=A0AA86SW05_9FABA|nr:unnamed protein product [Sphenostylis stenocarpa]
MVEINNQRKAFLDMLAWSEGTDNGRQKTRNHGYDVIVGGELFTDYSDHPRKLVTLNPKLKSTGAGRYQLLSRWWDAYRKQLGLKDFSPKSQDAVALQQIKERGALPMIDRGDIRQAIDRCSNIWASLPGAGYGQFEHKADSLIAKFKEAGGTVREIDRDKNARELKLANAAITDMQMRQRDVAALDAKYTKELADAKAENDALRDDVAAGRPRTRIALCQRPGADTEETGRYDLAWKDLCSVLNALTSAWSDKMNKEQSADDPSVDLIRVKNMLNSTISMSYPDVVIACIEHKVSLEAFRAIEAALVKHDNNMKDYSLVVD